MLGRVPGPPRRPDFSKDEAEWRSQEHGSDPDSTWGHESNSRNKNLGSGASAETHSLASEREKAWKSNAANRVSRNVQRVHWSDQQRPGDLGRALA